MKRLFVFGLFCLLSPGLFGQNHSIPFEDVGLDAAKPATCSVPQHYIATDTGKLYVCTAANTWTAWIVAPVALVDLTNQSANISSTPLYTPPADGTYRISCYAVVTTAAGTSSSLPSCQVNFTDADTGVSVANVNVTAGQHQ